MLIHSQHKDINKRSLGLNLVGWGVGLSNVLLFSSYYYALFTKQFVAPRSFWVFLSVFAVFPLDFMHNYLMGEWYAHLTWIIMMATCAMGILLLNKFARLVFIVMNIVHIVVLGYLVFMRFGSLDFVEYGFKLYFHLVVCGAYVGFLLIPDVREQFEVSLEGFRFWSRWETPRIKRIKPQNSQGLFKLSLAYENLGRYQDAVTALEKAVAIEPENAEFSFRLALNYTKLDKNYKAIDSLNKVLRIQPDHYEAHYFLGHAYMKEGSVQEGIRAFEDAAKSPRPHPMIYKDLGEAYIAAGRYQDGADALEKAVAPQHKDAEIFYTLGRLYFENLDRKKEAREYLMRAIRIDPDLKDAHMQLGLVCSKLARYKDAIRSFKEVLKKEPDNRPAHFQIGFAYAMIGDFDSARRQYHYLKRMDPDLAENLAMVIK